MQLSTGEKIVRIGSVVLEITSYKETHKLTTILSTDIRSFWQQVISLQKSRDLKIEATIKNHKLQLFHVYPTENTERLPATYSILLRT